MATYAITINLIGKDGASKSVKAVADAFDGLGRSVGAGAREVDGKSNVVIGALRRIGELGVGAVLEAGRAFASFVVDSIRVAGDFEAGMNRFGAVVGSSLDTAGISLEQFRDLFLQLGADTQFSAGQAQQAAIDLAKGGLDPATIAAGGLAAALDLAAAGEVDLGAAADILAKRFGVWASQSESAAEKSLFLRDAADLLAQAANASTVGVGDLSQGLAQAEGVARVAGLTYRETVTTLAMLAPGFYSASDAGTSFKVFLSRLTPATDKQADAMRELNLLTEDGKSVFYDATGSFVGMKKAAELLQNATKDLSQEQKLMALNTIFGQDAVRAAALIAERGAEGYMKMEAAMAAAGSAAAQAEQRNRGFNFALETLLGSLETFSIVAGTTLLPVLTAVINKGLIPLVDAATAAVPVVAGIATTVGDLAVPALAALAAATLAYAVVNLPALIASLSAAVIALEAKAVALGQVALATAAAVAPYVLLAAAVGGAAWAYQDFTTKVESASEKLLNSRQWWLDAGAAVESYKKQTEEARAVLEPAAATIEALRTAIQGEVEDLGRRMAAGLVTEEQYRSEMEAINQKTDALRIATEHYFAQEQAILAQAAAGLTATARLSEMSVGQRDLAVATALTTEEFEKYSQAIDNTFERATKHVDNYTDTYIEFQDTLVTENKEGQDQITVDQALAFAEQLSAQRVALGEMLANYTATQVAMGNITIEKGDLILTQIERTFGGADTTVQRSTLGMLGAIDDFASGSITNLSDLDAEWESHLSTVIDTKRELAGIKEEYTTKWLNDFKAGKITASELADALSKIPTRIETVHVTRRVTVDENRTGPSRSRPGEGPEMRAAGGPVTAGAPYIVGERGPELIIPEHDGMVVPNHALAGLGGTTINFYATYTSERTADDDLRSLALIYG